MKKQTLFKMLLLPILIIILTGCSSEKTYKHNGIEIKMMRGLFYKNHTTATIYYENNDIFVIGLQEKFEDLYELDMNNETKIEDYIQEVFLNREESYDVIKDDNLYYYTYEYEINNKTFYYVSTIHKSYDSFWICNFACKKDEKDKYHDLFIKWAKSITFY